MNNPNSADRFEIRINSNYRRNIYLSCSWRPDEGKNAAWVIVRDLDRNEIRAIGDIQGQQTQDPKRIARIMAGTSGFVCVLPYRPNAQTTSEYIVQELSLAIQQHLPIAFFYDDRVQLEVRDKGTLYELVLPNLDKTQVSLQLPLEVDKRLFYGPFSYKLGVEGLNIEEQLQFKITQYVDNLKSHAQTNEPYALIFAPFNDDFRQSRSVIRTAVEQTAGIPAICVDETGRYRTNIMGNRAQARELIRNAEFVVVDISRDLDTPYSENPTLAFELGQTDFSGKLYFVSLKQLPQYEPYYAIDDIQLKFWQTEVELYQHLCEWINARQIELGRFVYNRAPELTANDYTPIVKDYEEFTPYRHKSYPLNILSLTDRWLVAASLAAIVLSGAQLMQTLLNFSGSYDLLSIVASIVAGVFASFYNNILNFFASNPSARWTLYITAVIMTIIFIIELLMSAQKTV